MDRFRCLEAFVQVAEMRSVSRAAAVIGISKSVVSERVSQLERLVGQTLLFRSTRRIRLTEAGEQVYPLYADLVARLRDLPDNVSAEPSRLKGRLRVASVIDLGVAEMSSAVSTFARDNPELEIELVVGESLVNPVDDGFDLTLHYRRIRNDRVHQQAIARVETAVFAAPAYLAKHGVPETPQELQGHTCIGYSQQVTVNEWNASEWHFVRHGQRETVPVVLRARSNSGHVLTRWAVDGLGIAVLPRLRVQGTDYAHALREILPGYETPSLQLYASYGRAFRHTLKVTRFVASLREALNPAQGLSNPSPESEGTQG
ncbi:MAG: LysR family transcriptional regulator [Gammaproteobacteria bacterium]|nr:LysR family transcriptional regulator [Gammaproteobacteria bacterium]